MRVALLAAFLVLSAPIAIRAEEARRVATDSAVSCSCRTCDQAVCCKTPTGFQPLDDKCRAICRDHVWSIESSQTCASTRPQGCCP